MPALVIDPTNLSPADEEQLGTFLAQQTAKGKTYWARDQTYLFNDNTGSTTHIKLTHPVYVRGRSLVKPESQHPEEYDQIRYEVIAVIHQQDEKTKKHKKTEDELGSGATATSYKNAGTLTPQANGRVHFETKAAGKQRSAKIIQRRQLKITGSDYLVREKAAIEREVSLTQRAGQLHTKPVTYVGDDLAIITNRIAPGESLRQLLERNELTVEQRYAISLALITTAFEVLLHNGILHQDLSPNNIFVDLEQTPLQITFIDYGAAKDMADTENGQLGTPGYHAPEKIKHDEAMGGGVYQTPASDVFTLGRVLSQIWGNANFDRYGQSANEADLFNINPEQLELALFSGIDISPEAGEEITGIIAAMTAYYPKERCDLGAALARFSEITLAESKDIMIEDIDDDELASFTFLPSKPVKQEVIELLNTITTDRSSPDYQHRTKSRQAYRNLLSALQNEKNHNRTFCEIFAEWESAPYMDDKAIRGETNLQIIEAECSPSFWRKSSSNILPTLRNLARRNSKLHNHYPTNLQEWLILVRYNVLENRQWGSLEAKSINDQAPVYYACEGYHALKNLFDDITLEGDAYSAATAEQLRNDIITQAQTILASHPIFNVLSDFAVDEIKQFRQFLIDICAYAPDCEPEASATCRSVSL